MPTLAVVRLLCFVTYHGARLKGNRPMDGPRIVATIQMAQRHLRMIRLQGLRTIRQRRRLNGDGLIVRLGKAIKDTVRDILARPCECQPAAMEDDSKSDKKKSSKRVFIQRLPSQSEENEDFNVAFNKTYKDTDADDVTFDADDMESDLSTSSYETNSDLDEDEVCILIYSGIVVKL